jgi:hypothetical protein
MVVSRGARLFGRDIPLEVHVAAATKPVARSVQLIAALVCGIGSGGRDFAFLQRGSGYPVDTKKPGVDGVEHQGDAYFLKGSSVQEGKGGGKAEDHLSGVGHM